MSISALIELPEPIVSNEYVRPVQLTADHIPHRGGEEVIVVGRGTTEPHAFSFDQVWDKRIRHAEFTTMATTACAMETQMRNGIIDEPNSIICIRPKDNRSVGVGDSGMEIFSFHCSALDEDCG